MSVIPLRCPLHLLPTKPNAVPRFVNVASLPAAHKPQTLRLPISDNRFRKQSGSAFTETSGRRAAASIARRLEIIAESVVESEKQKLKAKLGGERLSEEEMLAVETMCREIVGKFLETPMMYLRSGGCCRSKFNDLELLAHIFEETYFQNP